ncbi:hypothetical protein HA050_05335 [Iodobacter sp. HSC-16F04]|uniref:Uncharacterized protein n=1 Tax=Iodobacter violaceini TaxID=3044271 RepID=A0ABX0KPM8_9NEIS|nr:hypothetical protein [Iodobacter violacea]NHQ85539.1 hypothetical protein [Iodobacter violacea]
MRVIVLSDQYCPELKPSAILPPAGIYADRVQELHIKVLHILIKLAGRYFFPQKDRG